MELVVAGQSPEELPGFEIAHAHDARRLVEHRPLRPCTFFVVALRDAGGTRVAARGGESVAGEQVDVAFRQTSRLHVSQSIGQVKQRL